MEDKLKNLIQFIRENNYEKLSQLLSGVQNPQELIEYEPDDPSPHPLYLASKLGHTKIVHLLLQNKGDPYVRHEKKGFAAIHVAVIKNYVDVVKELVEFDHDLVDLDTDTSGNDPLCTPLHFAVELDDHNVQILSYLIQSGADINRFDIRKRTPLWRATQRGHLYNIQKLLSSGVDVNLQDENGITPLGLAASLGYKSACELLLNHKANPNVKDRMGDTPLHHATQIQTQRSIFNYNLELSQNHLQTFTTLLLQGDADPGLCNNDGDTPLDVIDIPLANLFDHIINYKSRIRDTGNISFNSIIDKSEQQLHSEFGISPDDAKAFAKSIAEYHDFVKSKKKGNGPCTLVNTKLTPYKRKFKHLYDSGKAVLATHNEGLVGPNPHTQPSKCPFKSSNEGQESKVVEGVCPITGQRGIVPQGHAKLMEKGTPSKCPFSADYTPTDNGDNPGCAQQ